jgi:hypothetical protein
MKLSIIATSALVLFGALCTAQAQFASVDSTYPTSTSVEGFVESNPGDSTQISQVPGTTTIGFIQNNNWFGYSGYAYSNTPIPYSVGIEISVAKGNTTTASIEVRRSSATGTLLATIPVTSTGSFSTFTTVRGNFSARQSGGAGLFLVFKGGAGFLMDVKSIRLVSDELPRIPLQSPVSQVVAKKSSTPWITVGSNSISMNSVDIPLPVA